MVGLLWYLLVRKYPYQRRFRGDIPIPLRYLVAFPQQYIVDFVVYVKNNKCLTKLYKHTADFY